MAEWTNVQSSLVPPSGQSVPFAPEALTAEWLDACLRHSGAMPTHGRVAGFEWAQIGQGRGFAGKLVRISLRYESSDATGPQTVIGKFASEHVATREMMTAIDGYVREVRFYRELAPRIGMPTPRCYFAHYEAEQGRCCLLLEDLAPAASPDRAQGLSLPQAREVLGHLAVMHGRYWNRTDELPWLTLEDGLIEAVRMRFIDGAPRFAERWGGQYPEIARVAGLLATALDGDELAAQVRRPPLTLAHNDLHAENLFLPTAEGGRLCVIDWQSLSFARHGTTDVTRVLCVALRPELRRAHARELLDHYHRELCRQGVRGYSRFALGYRFRQEMVAMVMIGVLAFDTLDFGEAGQETATLLAERIELALRDAQVMGILRFMVALLRLQRVLRRIFGLARPRLPG